MKPRILLIVASALFVLILPFGVAMRGSQHATTTPEPPAAAELPELPEPPEPPEVPEPPAPALADSPFVFVGDGGTWLGVRLSDVAPEKAHELKLPGEYGARVIEVEPDSPAAKAGLQKDDTIVEFAGERVRSVTQLQRLVRETPAGHTVTLQVSRGGQLRTLNVKLEEGWDRWKMPHIQFPGPHGPGSFGYNLFFHDRGAGLGVTGEGLTRQLGDFFGVKQGKGVLVREVKEESAAKKAGLKAGDVIVRVEGKEVGSVEELRQALPHDLEEKTKVNLTIVRDRHEQTIGVELEPPGRAPLRRAERLGIPQVDLAEVKRLGAEFQKQAHQYQQLLQDYQRELQPQIQSWKKEWQRQEGEFRRQMEEFRRQWKQQEPQLKEEFRKLQREQLRRDEDVV